MNNNHKGADGDDLSIISKDSFEKESNNNNKDTPHNFEIDYQESLSEFEENERQIKSEIILEESLGKNQLNELKKELTIVQEEDSQDLSNYNRDLSMDESDIYKNDSPIKEIIIEGKENELIQESTNSTIKLEKSNKIDSNEIDEIVQHSYSPDYPTEPPPAYMENDEHHGSNFLKNQLKNSYYNFNNEDDNNTSADNYEKLNNTQNMRNNNESSGIQGIASAFNGLNSLAKAFTSPKIKSFKEQSFSEEDADDDDILESPLEEDTYFNKKEELQSKGLKMTNELSKLFEMIEEYTPNNIDPPYRLLPFIPDYAPAVGDVDPFIKIPRPDEVEDNLGLTILDEPAIEQSDPTAIGLLMSKNFKEISNVDDKDAPVKQISSNVNKTAILNQWITNVKEIQNTKQATTVPHIKNLPDIEKLMQEWPENVEKIIRKIRLPTANLNVDLKEFVDICLGIVDIPVIDSRIKSLHIFFTLYAEFKKSQHFKNMSMSDGLSQFGDTKVRNTDRLEL
ncbi:Intraflagellar transport protein 46 homolog [Strongyloides ratti]|uniref:Intraflagellar transport protein 46 homolog n=1 Tax=Strongyloides ratti TaxID=34506 RepID=A0A090KYN7_STRRB|nr:Intraflagellar transport protein 46 homolog [Strongyloides ratti]CEF60997.1 Intraflagellar transport protein 46 homolog [Strongyloides ratti]